VIFTVLMLLLTPGMEMKGSKTGFLIIFSHNLNILLIIFFPNTKTSHTNISTLSFFILLIIFFPNTKTSHTNISTLSFFNFFFKKNLKLTKNNYLQTKLELLLYSILSLIKDVYVKIVRK